MKPLIIGIDPGTTVGYTILSTSGEIINVGSKRAFDLDSLIKHIYAFGTPFLIGTDKQKTPSFVEKFAARVGAKIFSPSSDISVKEKMAFQKDTNNDHERDAYCAAFQAYKFHHSTLLKIDNAISEHAISEKHHTQIFRDVIIQNKPLNESIENTKIEDYKKERPKPIIKKQPEHMIPAKKYNILKNELNEVKKEKKQLEQKLTAALQKMLAIKKSQNNTYSEDFKKRELDFKSLWKKNTKLAKENLKIKKAFESFILNSDKYHKVIIINAINSETFEHIKNQKILIIKHPNRSKTEWIKKLNHLDTVIVPFISDQFSTFNQIPHDKIQIKKVKNIALVRKDKILRSKKQHFSLNKIVKEYQEDRS